MKDVHRLTPADTAGVYLASGWLLWVRDGALVAQRLDLARPALTGDPVTVADAVVVDGYYGSALSVSATGLVGYRASGVRRQLVWVDRSGRALGRWTPRLRMISAASTCRLTGSGSSCRESCRATPMSGWWTARA